MQIISETETASPSERLRRADLRPTARRLLVLEAAAALPDGDVNAMAILRFLYARGTLIPLPSLYRILRDMKHRGVLEHLH
ncbi:MAG: hypothetical protein JWQ73_285 [Variovorax sp.]|jgi:Fe2+ or Zn2+ uptake regulation protein|nr:hypothetical protein [Variovorax sp.]